MKLFRIADGNARHREGLKEDFVSTASFHLPVISFVLTRVLITVVGDV